MCRASSSVRATRRMSRGPTSRLLPVPIASGSIRRSDDGRLAGRSEQSPEPGKDLGTPVRGAEIQPHPLEIDGHVDLVLRQCTQAEHRQTWLDVIRVNGDALLAGRLTLPATIISYDFTRTVRPGAETSVGSGE